MFFTVLLVSFFLPARVTPSALLLINTTDLLPWKITDLSTHTPNGWPGSPPYSTFFVSITNPNTIPLPKTRWGEVSFPSTTANCSTKWIGFVEEEPFDRIIPCEVPGFSMGKWTMEIQKANVSGYGPSATRDFTLQFKLEESMSLNEGIVRLNFVGRVGFALRDNLRLVCAASGFCNTWLDEAKNPQLVVPVVEVECLSGVCENFQP